MRLSVAERRLLRPLPLPSSAPNPQTDEDWQAIFDGMPDGMLIADMEELGLVCSNAAISEMLGYSEEELLSMHVADVHPDDVAPWVEAEIRRFPENRTQTASEIPCVRKDGSVFYADVTGRLITYRGRPSIVAFFRDATARREAERALRRSESRLRNLVENMPDLMVLVDRDGAIRYVNRPEPAGGRSDLVGTVCFHHVAPQHLEQARYVLERAFQTGEVQTTVAADANGSWWEARIVPLPPEGRGPTAMLICTDITRRREAERALRESEAKLRGLFENLPDFVIVVDRTSTIQFVNRPVGPLTIEDLEGSRGFGWIARGFERKARLALAGACQSFQVQRVEVADVFNLWWDCRVVPLIEDGEVHNVMIICTDVTERKHSEESLRNEQRLLRRLLDLHERDRRVMAYEIHDSFAQMLAGAQLNFQAFERDVEPAVAAAESFQEGMRLLDGSLKETRRLISGLRPPVLDELGVVAAVEYLVCDHRTPGGPVIEYSAEVDFDRLAPPLESAVFRIVQESLANACRHSRTERIRVEMTERDDEVWIEVRDWGEGFETDRVDKSRFGLQGIRERARLLGGRATVESAPGVGTRVTVRLPLVHEPPDRSS